MHALRVHFCGGLIKKYTAGGEGESDVYISIPIHLNTLHYYTSSIALPISLRLYLFSNVTHSVAL